MKIDFTQELLMVDGEVMKRSNIDDKPATLGWVALSALLAESDESVDAKVRAFALAKRINEQTDKESMVELTPEEAIVVRDRIGKVFKNVTVVARSVELLNG